MERDANIRKNVKVENQYKVQTNCPKEKQNVKIRRMMWWNKNIIYANGRWRCQNENQLSRKNRCGLREKDKIRTRGGIYNGGGWQMMPLWPLPPWLGPDLGTYMGGEDQGEGMPYGSPTHMLESGSRLTHRSTRERHGAAIGFCDPMIKKITCFDPAAKISTTKSRFCK